MEAGFGPNAMGPEKDLRSTSLFQQRHDQLAIRSQRLIVFAGAGHDQVEAPKPIEKLWINSTNLLY